MAAPTSFCGGCEQRKRLLKDNRGNEAAARKKTAKSLKVKARSGCSAEGTRMQRRRRVQARSHCLVGSVTWRANRALSLRRCIKPAVCCSGRAGQMLSRFGLRARSDAHTPAGMCGAQVPQSVSEAVTAACTMPRPP